MPTFYVDVSLTIEADAGARIVAIMPAGVAYRSDTTRAEFREWLAGIGATISPNPPHAFRGAFRSTDVDTVTLFVTK
ncbi:MAG: hypothetical protein IT464_12605 [Planctomycetes bacterium]|nr:hypothetical protein [Planctomycetota bacterium]